MTLATHIVIAGAITKPMIGKVHPALAFAVALATHYLSDAIPHYDYHIGTAKQKTAAVLKIELNPTPRNIAHDLIKIGFDATVGFVVLLFFARPEFSFAGIFPYALVALAAILPDALQSVYWFWRKSPIKEMKIFHDYWHAKEKLKWDWLGLSSQALIFLFSVILLAH
jgi:hypothetical protein